MSSILIKINSELKEYLALYAVAKGSSRKRVIEKTVTGSARRLRTLHPSERLIDTIAHQLLCQWHSHSQTISKADFLELELGVLRSKGVGEDHILFISQKFVNGKEKNCGFDKAGSKDR